MSQTNSLQKITPSRPPGCSHYYDFPSHAALDRPDTQSCCISCCAHRVASMSSSENNVLACDNNLDQAVNRQSVSHCILGDQVPDSPNQLPPLPATAETIFCHHICSPACKTSYFSGFTGSTENFNGWTEVCMDSTNLIIAHTHF